MPSSAMQKFTHKVGCRFVCGWLPPLDTRVYDYDEITQLFRDYDDDKVGWFPIFRVGG